MLTLDNFKQEIDSTILRRGLEYARDNRVLKLEESQPGSWTAKVSGSCLYRVSVEKIQGESLSCGCSCPYDWGPICKHIAAVLWVIDGELPNVNPKTVPSQGSSPESIDIPVRQILEGVDKSALIEFLEDLAWKDEKIANLITARFVEEIQEKVIYAALIQNVISYHQRNRGFLDYHQSNQAAFEIWEIINEAETSIPDGRPQQRLLLYQAIIETLLPVLERADDSNGFLYEILLHGYDELALVSTQLPEPSRKDLYNYCLNQFERLFRRDPSFSLDIAQIAADLVVSQKDRDRLSTHIDHIIDQIDKREDEGSWRGNYYQTRGEKIKYSIIKRLDDENKRLEFLNDHLEYNDFRVLLVREHIKNNRLDRARELCAEWFEITERQMPGPQLTFLELLQEISSLSNNEAEYFQLTENLFFKSRDMKYFDQLKDHTPEDDWPALRDDLIKKADHTRDPDSIKRSIFIQEELWEDLLASVMKDEYPYIENYRKYLEPRFPREVCGIYEKLVWRTVIRQVNRKGYQQACRYIRRMKKLGCQDQARSLVTSLEEKYPNRPALRDELSKI